MQSPRLLAALAYAELGIPVFPCEVGGKQPAGDRVPNGFHDASTDPDVIIKWWSYDDYNLACCPEDAGWAVIDVDGEEGRATLAKVQEEHENLPETYTVETPRGGDHLYFAGSIASSVGNDRKGLGPKVDTRGRGGYVLLPPSVTQDGAYRVRLDVGVADLPEWPSAFLESRKHAKAETPFNAELDLPMNLRRADEAARSFPVMSEGGRNDAAHRLACKLLDLGLSEDAARERVMAWNDRCPEPLEPEEISTCVWSAWNNRDNKGAAPNALTTTAAETFAAAVALLPPYERGEDNSEPPRFRAFKHGELLSRPPPAWLVPGILPASSLAVLFGPSEAGKTFYALDLALRLATAERRCVVFVAGEGAADIVHNRVTAWAMVHGDLGDAAFWIIEDMPAMMDGGDVQAFADAMIEQDIRPDLIVLDTYARSMLGGNENDAKDVMRFVAHAEALKRTFNATVLAVAHTGKDTTRGLKGASTLPQAVDVSFEYEGNWQANVFSLWCRKMKVAEKPKAPWHFETRRVGKSVVIQPLALEDAESRLKVPGAVRAADIGRALQGCSKPISTADLAFLLTDRAEGEPEMLYQKRVEATAKRLANMAEHTGRAYVASTSPALTWLFPDLSKE